MKSCRTFSLVLKLAWGTVPVFTQGTARGDVSPFSSPGRGNGLPQVLRKVGGGKTGWFSLRRPLPALPAPSKFRLYFSRRVFRLCVLPAAKRGGRAVRAARVSFGS